MKIPASKFSNEVSESSWFVPDFRILRIFIKKNSAKNFFPRNFLPLFQKEIPEKSTANFSFNNYALKEIFHFSSPVINFE